MLRIVSCALVAVASATLLHESDDKLNMLQQHASMPPSALDCSGVDCDTGGKVAPKEALLQTEGDFWPFTSGSSDGFGAEEKK